MIIIKWGHKASRKKTDHFANHNGIVVTKFLVSVPLLIKQEVINLFSYIKKAVTSCSNIVRSDVIESSIVQTYSFNSFNRRTIDVISRIDRELIS
jgi:hypothetical protein